MEARKHVIMSHGGKHGPSSQTFLRGQSVTPEAAGHLPKALVGEAGAPAPAPASVPAMAVATPAGPPVTDPKDPPKAEPAATTQTPAPAASAPPSVETPPKVDAAKKRASGSLPSTKKAVMKLDRTEAARIAREALSLEVPDAMPLSEIQERIIKGLLIE
jgi:hypothetical protein